MSAAAGVRMPQGLRMPQKGVPMPGYFLNLNDCQILESGEPGVYVRGNILHHDDRAKLKAWAMNILAEQKRRDEDLFWSVVERFNRTVSQIARVSRQ